MLSYRGVKEGRRIRIKSEAKKQTNQMKSRKEEQMTS